MEFSYRQHLNIKIFCTSHRLCLIINARSAFLFDIKDNGDGEYSDCKSIIAAKFKKVWELMSGINSYAFFY